MRRAGTRGRALLGLVLLALPGPTSIAVAQGLAPSAATQPSPADPARFLDFAHSSNLLQARAAELAAAKGTRPEVKSFAQGMIAFRAEHLQRLQSLAQGQGRTFPVVKEFEHQVVLENLEPLDYLALSRRYAEVAVQALEQELRAYRSAASSADPALKGFADEGLPQLEQRLDAAKKVLEAVRP